MKLYHEHVIPAEHSVKYKIYNLTSTHTWMRCSNAVRSTLYIGIHIGIRFQLGEQIANHTIVVSNITISNMYLV